MKLPLSSSTTIALLLFPLVLLNYWPVFTGKVPLATDMIMGTDLFQEYQDEFPPNFRHAEMSDTVAQFYPWRKFAGEAIRHGELPLWNPHILAGTPFYSNVQSAVFYPLNLIFVLLRTETAWSLWLMSKVFLAGFFTALFLRALGATPAAAAGAGMVFGFGGFMTSWIGWSKTDVAIWLPAVCLCVLRLWKECTRRNAALLAVALAMPLLAGHPGIAVHVVAASAAYAIWLPLANRFSGSIRYCAGAIVAGGVALGLAAIQLLPSIEWLSYISRSLDTGWPALPLSNALAFFSRDLSTHPNSAGIPVPAAGVYAGALTLLCAALAGFHENRRGFIFFSLLFAVSFAVAFGISPFYNLSQLLPLFKSLKKDEALVLADFSLAVLAGLGMSRLEDPGTRRTTTLERMRMAAAVLMVGALSHWGTAVLSKMTVSSVDWWRSPRSFRFLLVASALLVLLRVFHAVTRRQWIVLSTTALAADLLSFSHGYLPFNPHRTVFPSTAATDFLRIQPQPSRVVSLDFSADVNLESIYGLYSPGGYDFTLKRLRLLTEGLIDGRGDLVGFTAEGVVAARHRILDLLNVKYLITSARNRSYDTLRTQGAGFREIWSSNAIRIFENPAALPRAFLVPLSGAEIISDDDAQLERLRGSDFEPRHRVILAALPPAAATAAGSADPAAAAEVTDFVEHPGRVRMRAVAPVSSVLVLSQMHYPGWTVDIDGKPAPLLRVNYAFAGTVVEAGHHDIEFRFRPTVMFAGAWISIVSVCLTVALATAKWPRKADS